MWLIFVIIVIIILFVLFKCFRRNKDNPINLYSGANGSGKTFNMTNRSRRALFRSRSKWKHINKPIFSWIYLWIPYFNKKRKNNELYGLEYPYLYSTYPILIRKNELSKSITNDIMLLEKSIPINSIVVIDEFSSWISQFEYKERFSEVLNDHLQKWRHYHGNYSRLYVADQCTNNIPIQVRYRVNKAIVCTKTKHYLHFIHITWYKYIELTDDIKSIEVIDNDQSDTDDKTLKFINFGFKRLYDDRAYSNRYYYVDKNLKHSKWINSKLKITKLMSKPPKDKNYMTIEEKENIEEKSKLSEVIKK